MSEVPMYIFWKPGRGPAYVADEMLLAFIKDFQSVSRQLARQYLFHGIKCPNGATNGTVQIPQAWVRTDF